MKSMNKLLTYSMLLTMMSYSMLTFVLAQKEEEKKEAAEGEEEELPPQPWAFTDYTETPSEAD